MPAHNHLSSRTFDALVERAIARLPEEIKGYLANVLITVQPRPGRELLADLDLPPDALLFGVFIGTPLPERSMAEPPLYPDTIHIFQEPLEAFSESREEIIDQIEITLVHEVAHFVGFSDTDLDALGYG
ncbi:MAG TPA: metallopeptidase family protein [Desulfopila sp.]|nr:metallopeptidase family protein [Desulfopila sp.]